MNTPVILHLVDTLEYVNNNCHQHQLIRVLQQQSGVRTVALNDLASLSWNFDQVICCLKQRTLFKYATRLAQWLGRTPITVYDQDPWEAYRNGSPYKGTYELVANQLNIKTFAVTTQSWVDYIIKQGLPAKFVSMWILPEYCNRRPFYNDRLIRAGFIGSLHPYRQKLFKQLSNCNIPVNLQVGNSLFYLDYLKALTDIKVFIHSEDCQIEVDDQIMNLKDGLWMREVEVASQGCFSIRNQGLGSETYCSDLNVVKLYDDPSEVPDLLHTIETMDPDERQSDLDQAVDYIKKADKWQQTARLLTET